VNRVGTSDVRLPALGFGAAAIGNLYAAVDEADAIAAVGAALDHDLTYFDTAPHYGFGLSERRLGEALADGDPSGQVRVSTKVGRLLAPIEATRAQAERHGFVAAAPFEPVFDYSYDAVMRSFDESRRRLRRERIDILYAHDLGQVTHGAEHERHFATFLEGGYRAMRALRDSGQVGAIGLGANEWQVCEQAMDSGEFDLFLLAGRYTLLEQTALDSFLPKCAERGVSVGIGGPYNSGILAEGTRSGRTLHYNYEPAPAAIVKKARLLEEACQEHGVPLAAAALQFPSRHPQVASVIPGLASAAQVKEAVDLFSLQIPDGFWTDLKDKELLRPDAPVAERLQ